MCVDLLKEEWFTSCFNGKVSLNVAIQHYAV